MWGIEKGARVYLALGSTDMRRGINGLSLMVEALLEEALFSGDLFVFGNRAQTTVKIPKISRGYSLQEADSLWCENLLGQSEIENYVF